MIEEFMQELEELKKCKKQLECALKDKQTMSDKLYEYMLKEYENTSYEDRCKLHIEHTCKSCRYRFECEDANVTFPQDVWKPIPSEKAWIPAHKTCEHFRWS